MAITAEMVRDLREKTGAGMMDCKKALAESGGDFTKAEEWLRKKGIARAGAKADRVAAEGVIATYVHGGRIGVMVEVNCETDFVARNEDFQALSKDIAMHVAAASPQYVTEEEVPEDVKQAELRIFEEQAADKPENVRPKIAEGRLRKWLDEVVLLRQPHVNSDKYEGQTIEEIRAATAAKTGENVVIRRFSRFAVGEE